MNTRLINILSRLSLSDSLCITRDILKDYEKNGSGIVNFLYFANIVLNNVHRDDAISTKKNMYIEALSKSDFLLPDGIALRILYHRYFGKTLSNLNGTDFLPYFLTHLPKRQKVEILLYGGTIDIVQKAAEYITDTFQYPVLLAQDGFTELDWSKIDTRKDTVIRILLVARGTPLQELWVENNRKNIQKMSCLVFTVGGLFGFWAGTEKRAPDWMRKWKIEWLYRALSDPEKNLKKTLASFLLLKLLLKK